MELKASNFEKSLEKTFNEQIMKDTQGNPITEEEFMKGIGHRTETPREDNFGQCIECGTMKNLPVGELCGRCYFDLPPETLSYVERKVEEFKKLFEDETWISKHLDVNDLATTREAGRIFTDFLTQALTEQREVFLKAIPPLEEDYNKYGINFITGFNEARQQIINNLEKIV